MEEMGRKGLGGPPLHQWQLSDGDGVELELRDSGR